MRKTKYYPGYGYITQTGSGFLQDAGIDLVGNIGRRVVGAIGEKIGDKIADKIVGKKKGKKSLNGAKSTRESVLKELELMPKTGLSDEVRIALYGSGIKKKSKL